LLSKGVLPDSFRISGEEALARFLVLFIKTASSYFFR
jgi:hypothetical protein